VSELLSTRQPAKTWALFCLLFASFMLAYYPIWQNLVGAWASSDDYSHGFLIIPLCAYIAWLKRSALNTIGSAGTPVGLMCVVAALLLNVVGRFGEIATLSSLSIIVAMAGVVLYLWGWAFLRAVSFPLFLMLFMIPVPAQIYSAMTIPLQLFVSKVSAAIVGFMGIPVFLQGNVIFLPDRTLEVVQACSGLRSIMALLTLAVVFGYFTLRSNVLRIVLLAGALPTALLVNIIRVMLLVLAEYLFRVDLSKGVPHTLTGLAVFASALLMIALLKRGLSIWDKSDTAAS
jgi:exosortase